MELFDDIEVAEVRVSGHSKPDAQAHEAWGVWCDLTKRPDRGSPDREFLSTYRDLMVRNYDHDEQLRVINGAARMQPRPRDPRDVRRVLGPLTRRNYEMAALELLREDSAIVPYPNNEPITTKSSLSNLGRLCGVSKALWSAQDIDSAAVLVSQLDYQEIEDVVETALLAIGKDVAPPHDIYRSWIAGESTVSRNDARDTYSSGAREIETLEEMLLEADAGSEKMLRDGVPLSQVAKYHALAPEGYWDEVLDILESHPELKLSEIYDQLATSRNWHPDTRKKETS